jgi:hypothetical protein
MSYITPEKIRDLLFLTGQRPHFGDGYVTVGTRTWYGEGEDGNAATFDRALNDITEYLESEAVIEAAEAEIEAERAAAAIEEAENRRTPLDWAQIEWGNFDPLYASTDDTIWTAALIVLDLLALTDDSKLEEHLRWVEDSVLSVLLNEDGNDVVDLTLGQQLIFNVMGDLITTTLDEVETTIDDNDDAWDDDAWDDDTYHEDRNY